MWKRIERALRLLATIYLTERFIRAHGRKHREYTRRVLYEGWDPFTAAHMP